MFWIRKGPGSALALPFRAALSAARQRYRGLPFVVRLPDGHELCFGVGEPAWRVRLHSWRAVAELTLKGLPGLGAAHARIEASIDGERGLAVLDIVRARASEDVRAPGRPRAPGRTARGPAAAVADPQRAASTARA